MRTTVELNDTIYKTIITKYGKRNISNTINEILFKHLIKQEKKNMFGVDPWLKKQRTKNLRDEYDRHL
jgi:hypothetical protein